VIAAIYARRSKEQRGADEEAKSVTLQVRNARAFAAERGWTVAEDHIYTDDAVSGADVRKLRERQRLLDVISKGAPFQVLIVREESRFSRRDGDVAFAELKQIARAGVEVWFYQERKRFTYGTFGENIVGFVKAEAAADYRRQIARWTHDAMVRRARAGHVTGGRLFGYENVRVEGHVERRIIEPEAAVVKEIFERSVRGEGLRAIAKALNAAGAPTPRSQQRRPRGWAPSSVREVLHRDSYRGVLSWNRTKKRDLDGQQRQHDRPLAEWITQPAEHLRIIDDALWQAVQARLHDRQAGAPAARPLIAGRGIRQRYFLPGFARCARCGGSMQAVSRSSSRGRTFRYVCATYWNRGSAICGNGLMAGMHGTDGAVRTFLKTEVLQPHVVGRALDLAVQALEQRDSGRRSHADAIQAELSRLDLELANLAETVAHNGAVPAVIQALQRRDADRRRLTAELAALDHRAAPARFQRPANPRAILRSFLKDWDSLLTEHSAKARGVLDIVLTDRIRFEPDPERRRYQLTIPIAFDRLIVAVAPTLGEGLQEMVASPRGTPTDGPLRIGGSFRAA